MNQLDKNLQGRIQWMTGTYSTMSTSVTYDSPPHRCVLAVQLAMKNTLVSAAYTYTFVDYDAKARISAKSVE